MPLDKGKARQPPVQGGGKPAPVTAVASAQCSPSGNVSSHSPCSTCLQFAQLTAAQQCKHSTHQFVRKHMRTHSGIVGQFPTAQCISSGLLINCEPDLCSSSGGEQGESKFQSSAFLHHVHQKPSATPSSSPSLPPALKVKLYELFGQIEKEFELLYSENLALQEKVEILSAVTAQESGAGGAAAAVNSATTLSASASTSTISTLTAPSCQIHRYNQSSAGHDVIYHSLSTSAMHNASELAEASPTASHFHNFPNHLLIQQNSFHQRQQHQHPFLTTQHRIAAGAASSMTPTAAAAAAASAMASPSYQQQPMVQQKSSNSRVHKLRSHTNRLRQQTTRIMSNLSKGPSGGSSVNCVPLRRYLGHRDGVWEVSVSRLGLPIIGTASADHTAIVWGIHSGQPLLQYTGHSGSVNSLRFHPRKELVLTASGDGSVHIWQCAVHLHNESSSGRMASSEDELDPFEKENNLNLQNATVTGILDGSEAPEECPVLRTPLRSLVGHHGVVIAADWLPGGEQAVTAGWDRLACIWDTQTGQLLHQLAGHDDELTHAAAHPTQNLVVTSSKDSTFRLWDFRESIHSVSVFQGHQDTVTSAVFYRDEEKVVSGSDDRSARIWDLRQMRSPVATIQSDSAVNRLAVASCSTASSSGLIAIPFDNRNVRIYDMSGSRVGRLPRSNRQQGHSRMVCCTAWAEPIDDIRPNLFTCGFDRVTLGWSIQPRVGSGSAKENEAISAMSSTQVTGPMTTTNATVPIQGTATQQPVPTSSATGGCCSNATGGSAGLSSAGVNNAANG